MFNNFVLLLSSFFAYRFANADKNWPIQSITVELIFLPYFYFSFLFNMNAKFLKPNEMDPDIQYSVCCV